MQADAMQHGEAAWRAYANGCKRMQGRKAIVRKTIVQHVCCIHMRDCRYKRMNVSKCRTIEHNETM